MGQDSRRGAVYRVARRLLASGARTIGCVPPTRKAMIPACSREIAMAMAELSGDTMVVVDAGLFGHRHYDESGPIAPGVRVLRPAESAKAEDFIEIFQALADEKMRALVDLTGYRERGALSWALSALEGVLIMVFSAKASDSDILAVSKLVPPDIWAGVVVFDSPPPTHPVDKPSAKEY